jgi:hypothetical protein
VDENNAGFVYMFHRINDAKIKEGLLGGPPVRELILT